MWGGRHCRLPRIFWSRTHQRNRADIYTFTLPGCTMLSDLKTFLISLWGAIRFYPSELWKQLNQEPVFIWSQAIAFKVLITLLPLILIGTGIFGLVLRQENPFETVAAYLRTFLPEGQSEALIDLLQRLQQTSPALTIIGGAFLLVVVITLFSVLRYVIGTAMGEGRHRYRSILRGYLFDIRMVIQVGLLFLLSFGLTLAINYLLPESRELLASWGFNPDILVRGENVALRLLAVLVPYTLSLFMFWQLYYFIPQPRTAASSALFGAFFAAALFDIAKNGFTIYVSYLGQFSRYGTGDEAISGAFGLVIAFVLWVYFSGLVFIIGAMLTRLHERRNKLAPAQRRRRRLSRRK